MQHVSRAYHELAFEKIKAFCLLIKAGFFGNNPPFVTLPMTESDYGTLITNYDTAYTAYTNGGDAQHGAFLVAKTALMAGTDKLAVATDGVAQGDPDIITLAGFTPTKTRGEGVKPEQCIVEVERGIGGELVVTCEKIDNAKAYGCIMTEGAPLPEWVVIDANGRLVWDRNSSTTGGGGIGPEPVQPSAIQIDFTTQRTKHFQNLTHDATYYFYYFAINATGVGPLSEVVSMVCW